MIRMCTWIHFHRLFPPEWLRGPWGCTVARPQVLCSLKTWKKDVSYPQGKYWLQRAGSYLLPLFCCCLGWVCTGWSMWWSWWQRRRRRRTQVDRQGRLCRGLLGRWATKSLPPTWKNISSLSTVVQRQWSPDFVNSLNLGWDLFVWQRRWVGGERRGGRGGGALAFKSWGAACSETVCDYHHHRGEQLVHSLCDYHHHRHHLGRLEREGWRLWREHFGHNLARRVPGWLLKIRSWCRNIWKSTFLLFWRTFPRLWCQNI